MRSLERQLPLAAFALLTLVAGAVTWAAYDHARQTTRDLFGERLSRVSDQLSVAFAAGVPVIIGRLETVAQHPTVVRALADPDPLGAAAAAALFSTTFGTSQPNLVIGLWDLAGDIVASMPPESPSWVPPPPLVDQTTTTPVIASAEGVVHHGYVAPVRDGRRLVGFVQVRQRLGPGPNPGNTELLEALLGESGRVLLGTPGGAWTDMRAVVEAPPDEVADAARAVDYEREGVRLLGVGRTLPGTQVVFVSEVGQAAALAAARTFLGRVGLIASLLVAAATFAAWLLGRRITAPLSRLRTAAEGLGSGDYARRADETGHPEIREVAHAFNSMAAELEGQVGALQASEERFRSLVTATAQIVWWTDAEGNVADPLPSWQAFTGQTFAEVSGSGWTAALHADDAANALRAWREAVAHKSLHETEYRIRRHDGEYRWFVARGVPILERNGSIREWVGTCTDTTERRRAEENLKRKEVELQRSQRLDAVGRLAGGIAHDFNNLLTAIVAPADLADQELPPDHPVRDDLRDIRSAAFRASELTRKLLAFGSQQVMSPVVLDANHLIQSAASLLKRVISETVVLDLALHAEDATVRIDQTQFEQIIVNLSVNARDAMPEGGRLTIDTSRVDVDAEMAAEHPGLRPGRFVVVAVTDTGSGMDPETLKRIFEPFFTTKDQDKGTGLGLSTVYGIVHQSNGHILVYSEPGQGSCFKIYLPYVDEEMVTPAVEPSAGPAALEGGSETILFTEDDPAIRRHAVRILSKLGYRVLPAESGREALELASRHGGPIDLLVSDVVMAEMNGIELWEQLRVERPGVPALFTSGWASGAVVKHGILDGQVPFLPKPFSVQQLAAKVREVLSDGT